MIDVVVMAHPKRDEQATALADRLGGREIWDERNDEWDTGRRCWEHLAATATDWGLVVQDDAEPVDGMRRHAEQALIHAPRTAVSFYVGTGRPRAHRVNYAAHQARSLGASWLECDSLLWGVAVALPVEHIAAMLAWAASSQLPYDQRISAYYRRVLRQPVRHTWPSLVDHADGDGLVDHGSRPTIPRKAHHVGPWQPGGPTVRI